MLHCFPEVATEWDFERNAPRTPNMYTKHSGEKVWWKCQHQHSWEAPINGRTGLNQAGCPFCSGRYAMQGNNLADQDPRLAKQWHPTKNGDLSPRDVTPKSSKIVWWICIKGHEWQTRIKHRAKGTGCPYCAGKLATSTDNFQVQYPDISEEWHPNKNGTLIPAAVRPQSNKKVWWMCKYGHEWHARIQDRANGTNCPECWGLRRKGR